GAVTAFPNGAHRGAAPKPPEAWLRITEVNTTPAASTRYNAGSQFDRATARITRVVVPTTLGDVVAHVDPNAAALSDTATLLLHGAAGSWTTWLPLIRASQEAGSPLQNVVALDLPGWGESGSISADATVED